MFTIFLFVVDMFKANGERFTLQIGKWKFQCSKYIWVVLCLKAH